MSFNRRALTPIRDYRNNVVQFCEDPNDGGYSNTYNLNIDFSCPIPTWANYVCIKTTSNGLWMSQKEQITNAPPSGLTSGSTMSANEKEYVLINQRDDDKWHAILPDNATLYFYPTNGGGMTVNFYAGPEMNSDPAPEGD